MSLIFGRQVFVTLAEIADAVIQQITLNQSDYNTLYGMVQAAQASAQAKYPGKQLFFVTFSDDPYGSQGGWVRQIAVCHNSAGVPTHWDNAVEFPMIATQGGYYADLSGAVTVQNTTGSSIGTFTPPAPPSDGTGSDGSTSDGTTPPPAAVSLTTVVTVQDGTASGFATRKAADSIDHYWLTFMSTNNWPMSRRFFWMLVFASSMIYYDNASDSYLIQGGQTQASILSSLAANFVQVDGIWEVTDLYASIWSGDVEDH